MGERQSEQWKGDFGRSYTDRNAMSLDAMEGLYRDRYGRSRRELNGLFLADLDRASKILEVGANIGNQLLGLQSMGFHNLTGIELQSYAVERFRKRTRGIAVVQASAAALPFPDASFDLVFTSGVLIHIPPALILEVLAEIHRCTARYIWGMEYFAERHTEVPYRGRQELLWKGDFSRLYRENFSGLRLLREEHLPYRDGENRDSMFLLRKD